MLPLQKIVPGDNDGACVGYCEGRRVGTCVGRIVGEGVLMSTDENTVAKKPENSDLVWGLNADMDARHRHRSLDRQVYEEEYVLNHT